MAPRTVDQILEHADELAKRFETGDFGPGRTVDGASLLEVGRAFRQRALAERELTEAVLTARAEGHSWAMIGSMIGTSGEAARQRYGA